MNSNKTRKLQLSRTTLRNLGGAALARVVGGISGYKCPGDETLERTCTGQPTGSCPGNESQGCPTAQLVCTSGCG